MNRLLEKKVADRTAELQEKNNDILNMMQNMHQGLLTITRDVCVHHAYAAYCEDIFETSDIANRSAMDLLFGCSSLGSDVLSQIKTALDSLAGEDEMMWDFNSHLLVPECEISLPSGSTKLIELDWDPIILDGEIDKVMVTVRDVTSLRALQAEAHEQKHELEIIGQILSLKEDDFSDFIHSSESYIRECRSLVRVTSSKDSELIAELFRNMHTVKGNARTYGLTHITDSVHEAESYYDQLRKDEQTPWEPKRIQADLDRVSADLLEYKVTATEKLGRSLSLKTDDEQQALELANRYDGLSLKGIPEEIQAYLHDSHQFFLAKTAQPLSEALKSVCSSAAILAEDLNKPQPNIVINDGTLWVKRQNQATLKNIFSHLISNSLDHGIESAKERRAYGKAEQGTITIYHADQESQGHNRSEKNNNGHVCLFIEDDGRGLPLHQLKIKGQSAGTLADSDQISAQEVAEQIFYSGMSTANQVSLNSGRGVGMEAVRQFLRNEGGDVQVILKEQTASTDDFAAFRLELSLPKQYFVSVVD